MPPKKLAPKAKVAPKAKDAGDVIQVFQAYDTNGDKIITKDDLGFVLKKLDNSWTDKKIEMLLKEIDSKHDGQIDYEEFVEWITISGKGGDKRQAVRQAALKVAKGATSDSGAASSGKAANTAETQKDLDEALEELFKFYDLDEDGQIERLELLEVEESRLGQLGFPIKVRKEAIQWFKDAGAVGDAVKGLFLSKEKWKVAMTTLAADGAKSAEDATLQEPAAWLREKYKELWELHAPKMACGGGAGEGAEDGMMEPPDWLKLGGEPLLIDFKELSEKISESQRFMKNILICTSGKSEVETFINYRNFILVDGKAIVSRVFGVKNQTMAQAQEEAQHSLTGAMNSHGFCKQIHFRLNSAALDFSRFCCAGFPEEVFDRQAWTIDEAYKRDFFDGGHKAMLEADDRWNTFNIVITSTFDLEGVTEFLKDKIPHFDKLGILVVDPASIS